MLIVMTMKLLYMKAWSSPALKYFSGKRVQLGAAVDMHEQHNVAVVIPGIFELILNLKETFHEAVRQCVGFFTCIMPGVECVLNMGVTSIRKNQHRPVFYT